MRSLLEKHLPFYTVLDTPAELKSPPNNPSHHMALDEVLAKEGLPLSGHQSFGHEIRLASSLEIGRQQHRSKRKTMGMKEEKPTSCSTQNYVTVAANFTSEQPKRLMVVLPPGTRSASAFCTRPSITHGTTRGQSRREQFSILKTEEQESL